MKIEDIKLSDDIENTFDSFLRSFNKSADIDEELFAYQKNNFDAHNYQPLKFQLIYVPTDEPVFIYSSSYRFGICDAALKPDIFKLIVKNDLLTKFKEYADPVLDRILPKFKCQLFNLPIKITDKKLVFNNNGESSFHDLECFKCRVDGFHYGLSLESHQFLLDTIKVKEVK